ncbi:hypothetical protein GCM10007420_26620 [Glycocaulis albus]|uniref:Uncharacterized protein n=1 Tax=Glycocaulis albus TaxID=1382801 RepID=A0ABQ1Y0N1_9PROT|nr:hypothetical protein GCM10007420_26620 [Glycocaulis albus]
MGKLNRKRVSPRKPVPRNGAQRRKRERAPATACPRAGGGLRNIATRMRCGIQKVWIPAGAGKTRVRPG